MRQWLAWRPSDPGHFALRVAVRMAIVTPVCTAIGLSTGQEQLALFAVFGSIALGLFVDFGGPRPVRVLAYLALVLTGCVLISLGTLCSQEPILAGAAMAVVGFVVLFCGIFNGYFAAAGSAALLTFILPSMVPVAASAIPERLAGWGIAAAITIPAALFLFPARPRDRLRAAVAEAARALAAFAHGHTPQTEAALLKAIDTMHERFAATPFRPTGPTGATGALAAMIDELDWLKGLALLPPPVADRAEPTPAQTMLREASIDALLASAALIEGKSHELPDSAALERGREAVVDELLAQLADPEIGGRDDRMWAALVRAWEVRVYSFVALDVAEHATYASGHGPDGEGPRWLGFVRRQSVALAAGSRVAAAHAGARSVWFRNSLRGAIGLGLAVLLAGEASVQHAFWVVLGALSVLRSSALSTGATAVRALLGTLVGIIVGGALLVAIGSDETVLWILLPFAVLLAAYAPRAISFAAGQAGFTIVVFLIFDLIQPSGWEVGLIRLEDVSIGFGIALGVGLLFWPRGAAAVLRRSLADAMEASSRYVLGAFERLASGAPASHDALLAAEADAALGRLDVAFRQVLAERPSHDRRVVAHTRVMTSTARLRSTAGAMDHLAGILGDTPRPAQAHQLVAEAMTVAAWFERLGDAVAEHRSPPAPQPPLVVEEGPLVAGIREAVATGDRETAYCALLMLWGGFHLAQLRRLEERVAEVTEELATPHPTRNARP